jgi:uncharacterized repeat protein (TIGR02543 family)
MLQNIGNVSLTFQTPGVGGIAPLLPATGNFALDASNTCAVGAGGTLASAASCALAIKFTPQTASAISENAMLTNDDLNWTPASYAHQYATQKISLSGTGTAGTLSIAVTLVNPASIVHAAGTAVALTTSVAYGGVTPTGAVAFTLDGDTANAVTANCTGASSPLTCTANYTATSTLSAGNHTLVAAIAADGNYAAASSDPDGNGTLIVDAAQTILNPAITVTAPVAGAAPNPNATTSDVGYTLGVVAWNPADSVFVDGTAYTATLTLSANTGYTFTGLAGGSINGSTATISNNTGGTVTLAYTFPATAVTQYALTVIVTGSGSVSDGETPPQIAACTATGGVCSGSYASGTTVTLTATPETGYSFAGWSGDCSGTATTTTVTMTAARNCSASFTASTPDDTIFKDGFDG